MTPYQDATICHGNKPTAPEDMRAEIKEALQSLDSFYEERAPFLSCEPVISQEIPGFIFVVLVTDYEELQVEVIDYEQLLLMHEEAKERIQDGECLHDAWLNAMTILYE